MDTSLILSLPSLSSSFDFFAQLSVGVCRNTANLGNYDCLPILFPDYADYLFPGGSDESVAYVEQAIEVMRFSRVVATPFYGFYMAMSLIKKVMTA